MTLRNRDSSRVLRPYDNHPNWTNLKSLDTPGNIASTRLVACPRLAREASYTTTIYPLQKNTKRDLRSKHPQYRPAPIRWPYYNTHHRHASTVHYYFCAEELRDLREALLRTETFLRSLACAIRQNRKGQAGHLSNRFLSSFRVLQAARPPARTSNKRTVPPCSKQTRAHVKREDSRTGSGAARPGWQRRVDAACEVWQTSTLPEPKRTSGRNSPPFECVVCQCPPHRALVFTCPAPALPPSCSESALHILPVNLATRNRLLTDCQRRGVRFYSTHNPPRPTATEASARGAVRHGLRGRITIPFRERMPQGAATCHRCRLRRNRALLPPRGIAEGTATVGSREDACGRSAGRRSRRGLARALTRLTVYRAPTVTLNQYLPTQQIACIASGPRSEQTVPRICPLIPELSFPRTVTSRPHHR
jgi:hypothetical protein